MGDCMEVDNATTSSPQVQIQENQSAKPNPIHNVSLSSLRDNFRDIQVKVHVRKPEGDVWVYLGRGLATQEVSGHSSRVVVRAATGKILATFGESSNLQAEKRGNFVVVGCVEATRVVSWSLNALNNSETLRLLASIELACYRCKQALSDPRMHSKGRRKVERIIKDDRRRRHRRRKEQEAMIDAFAKQRLHEPVPIETSLGEPLRISS